MRSRIGRNLLVVVGCLAVYVVCPVPGKDAPPVLSWLLFAGGVIAIAWAVAALVRRRRTAPEDNGVRLEALVALVYALVVFFALTYLSLATRDDEFVDLHNRVDAMYFTVSTVATVGFGDVHAVGSAARIAVTVQMAMDLLVLGIAARLVGPAIARRWAEKGVTGQDGPRDEGPRGDPVEPDDHGDPRERDDGRPFTPEG